MACPAGLDVFSGQAITPQLFPKSFFTMYVHSIDPQPRSKKLWCSEP